MEDTAFEHKAKTIVIITFYRQTTNCNKCCEVWGARKEYKEIFFRSDDLERPLRRTSLRQEMEPAKQTHRDHFWWKGTMCYGSEMRKGLVCSRIKKRQGLFCLGHRSKRRGGQHCSVFSSWFCRESRSSEWRAFHNARGRGANRLIYLSHLTNSWKMDLKGAGIKSGVKGKSGGLRERDVDCLEGGGSSGVTKRMM